jgi:uncharacterized cupin superfamily protein
MPVHVPGFAWGAAEGTDGRPDELVTLLEGEMEVEFASVVHHPQVGAELLIPAGAAHSARNVGKATARWRTGPTSPGCGPCP